MVFLHLPGGGANGHRIMHAAAFYTAPTRAGVDRCTPITTPGSFRALSTGPIAQVFSRLTPDLVGRIMPRKAPIPSSVLWPDRTGAMHLRLK